MRLAEPPIHPPARPPGEDGGERGGGRERGRQRTLDTRDIMRNNRNYVRLLIHYESFTFARVAYVSSAPRLARIRRRRRSARAQA